MKRTGWILSGAIAILSACAPVRVVKPLQKNQQVVGLNVGGPLVTYSAYKIPMPLSAAFYARGITDKTTAFGGIHLTSFLFGVLQTDIGACTQVYYNNKLHLGLSTSPVLNIAIDKWERNLKTWPQLDVNTYWESNSGKVLLYGGVSNWLELAKYRENETRQPRHWYVNPHLGLSYAFRRWNFVLETKYLAPTISNQPNVVEYQGINGHGAIGIYATAMRTLR